MTQVAAESGAAQATTRDLEPLFAPRSVAVVGASRTPGSVGNAIMQNMVEAGFTGVVYPVNPKAKAIFGNACVKSISAIDEPPDLVVLAIPAPFIEGVIAEAADKGTRNFVIISAGFKEIGGEGREREISIRKLAQKRGLNIVGPNCLGVINTAQEVRMNASFSRDTPTRRQPRSDLAERCLVHGPAGLRQGPRHWVLAVRQLRQQGRRHRS